MNKYKTVLIQYVFSDPDEIKNGLMYRRYPLTTSTAAIFVFENENNMDMWMLNTYDSLDMIFLNKDKQVLCIHTNTTPLSTNTLKCPYNSKYIIEALAGYVDNQNIQIGDTIIFNLITMIPKYKQELLY
jgi:uncharacterized membrane protein (UPF0127 family)